LRGRDRQHARARALPCAHRRAHVFAIQFPDETGADLGGTDGFAFVGVRAVAETFRVHRAHHFKTRLARSGSPWGKSARCETLAAVKSMADAFGHAAAHAPQPMHPAASIARSTSCFGIEIEFASGAEPARAEMNPPACTMRSSALPSITRSLMTGNE